MKKFFGFALAALIGICAFAQPPANTSYKNPDNNKSIFGTDNDFALRFNSSNSQLEVIDAAGNVMASVTDAGSNGTLTVNAATLTALTTATISASGQITSTLATGTAPFVIASTTKVTNLNADLLDGADWSALPTLTLPDDTDLIWGTDSDIRVRYDEAGDDRLEFHDGTNLLAYVRDAGTTGNLGVTGSLLANTIAVHSGSTATLYNSATAITMGATSGSLTLRNPTITLAPGAGATTFNQTGAHLVFAQTPGAGVGALIDFSPTPDSTSPANVRFFRLTNTTGDRLVTFFVGNGAGDIGYRFRTRTAAQGSPVFDIFDGAAGASAVKISLFGSGDGTFAGDLAVNGGDLTSSATNFGLLTAPSGTLTAFTNFTTLNLGNNTGAAWTLVGTSIQLPATITSPGSTTNLINTTATTLNFAGATTTLNMGAGSGATANFNFGTINSNQSSMTYYASPTTNTVFGNAATSTFRGLSKFAYDGTNNTIHDVLVVRKTSNSDPTQTNMGAGLAFELENAGSPSDIERAGRIHTYWTTATDTIEDSNMFFTIMRGGSEITVLKLIAAGAQGAAVQVDYDLVSAKRIMYTPVLAFTANDTTPSVAAGNTFSVPGTWTAGNNITAFDDGMDGQVLTVIGGDSDCVVVDGSTLVLNGNWTAAPNATLTLLKSGANWYEQSRSAN